ncbi:YPO3983 family protein [Serratia rubidaea]|uniref:YPO3983 family protein n=1 Tax=Serratia rubidaea TaxID=61652 RepID=UPI003A4C5FB6
MMAALQFPCTIFKTQKRMDDYGASDMRCGDLSASQLKTHFRLADVSTTVDPWTLTRKRLHQAHPRAYAMVNRLSAPQQTLTRRACAAILFDELRQLSRMFALYGPYKYLIGKMIDHLQYGNGTPFASPHLDRALREHILGDNTQDSSRLLLKDAFNKYINWENKFYPKEHKDQFRKYISISRLPKFDRFQDNFNGMGITVHDTWATDITIKSLQVDNNRYRAIVHYKVQDHFGLDNEDILKIKFKQLRFFRIWFVLQRYN